MVVQEQIEKMCCVECFDDEGIKEHIREYNKKGNCDFCESKDVYFANVSDVGRFIMECVGKKYEDPTNSVFHDSSEGGYDIQGDFLQDILIWEEQIFSDLIDDPDPLFEALIRPDGTLYVRKDPYGPSSGGWEMSDKWEEFSTLVKTNRRFSILIEEQDKEIVDEYDDYPRSIPKFLNNLIDLLFEEFLTVFEVGKTYYRARIHTGDFKPCHEELTSPPIDKTINSRMSPERVRFFYGSIDIETSIAEIRPQIGDNVIVGKFKIRKQLSLLDLSKKGLGHSIFDNEYDFYKDEFYNPFLERFLESIAKPLTTKDSETEYLPTQVFTELIRFHEKHHCDGILYRSSQNVKGINIVLFNEANISTVKDKETDAWLNYDGYETKRIVSLKYESQDTKTHT
jgi:hypothetical protein